MKICRECGAWESDVEFKPNANICKPCNAIYMKDYRKRNKDKIGQQVQEWKDTNREQHRATTRDHYHNRGGRKQLKARYEKNPRVFMSKQLGSIRARSKNPGPHDPKDPIRRMWDIDLDYVMELWESQDGMCALIGISMAHEFGNLRSVSVDRIDSSKGHIKGNIQLICSGLNRLKNTYDNDDVLKFLREAFEAFRNTDTFTAGAIPGSASDWSKAAADHIISHRDLE